MKRTKIVATIGPSTSSENMIEKLILAGVNTFRFNFSHGTHKEHEISLKRVRNISTKLSQPISILQDLSGPKLRISQIEEPFLLHTDEKIDIVLGDILGNRKQIGLNYPDIFKAAAKGSLIFIADGTIKLKVIKNTGTRVTAITLAGGVISSRKGVNFPNIQIDIPALTDKDIDDIKFGIKIGVDLMALSFVKNAEDILHAKNIIRDNGSDTPLFAKIEKHEAIKNLDEIIKVSDGIMVARGDLGIEVDLEQVPVLQKMIIKKANLAAKPVITATQMLTSMMKSARPTRAEVSDIANAVLDGTDAVMLSDETTIGDYPEEAVDVMKRTIIEAETIYNFNQSAVDTRTSHAIADASTTLARDLNANAIVAFTKTGASARYISRSRPKCRILASVCDDVTFRRLSIVWGVEPYMIIPETNDSDIMLKKFAEKAYADHGLDGIYIITIGSPAGIPGSTNVIRVLREYDLMQFIEKLP